MQSAGETQHKLALLEATKQKKRDAAAELCLGLQELEELHEKLQDVDARKAAAAKAVKDQRREEAELGRATVACQELYESNRREQKRLEELLRQHATLRGDVDVIVGDIEVANQAKQREERQAAMVANLIEELNHKDGQIGALQASIEAIKAKPAPDTGLRELQATKGKLKEVESKLQDTEEQLANLTQRFLVDDALAVKDILAKSQSDFDQASRAFGSSRLKQGATMA